MWRIASTRAVIGGRDTGEAIEPVEQTHLAAIWVPRIGLLLTRDGAGARAQTHR